ncbi:MAG: prolipoprotein diacylglyceryl transferase [Syntrophales bacterium]|nr:prolipoprotein diacylglyceryl transferase [Syntrophales bacterium]
MENLINYWQTLPSHINPNIITIGAFQLRYYSLMYLVAFFLTYKLVSYRLEREDFSYSLETIQDFFVWGIFGLIIGARLGYVLFYNLLYYLRHPLEIILPLSFSQGIRFVGISGMSYHGGALGVIISALIFCHKRGINFWNFADLFSPTFPLGYTFGRIGNFINGELFGRVTASPWGMFFPFAPSHELRHPSQLYEAFFEGVVLFVVLWIMRKKRSFAGLHIALYIIGYGIIRFFIEFYREPDEHLGFIWKTMSMGQILCIAMIMAGLGIIIIRKTGKKGAL